MMEFPQLAFLSIVTLLCYAVIRYLKPRHTSQEPPALPTTIPIVGHIFGLVRHGLPYIVGNAKWTQQFPIFTVELGLTRIYVVNSSKIVRAVQRNAVTIWSEPVLTEAARRMSGIDSDGVRLLQATGNKDHSVQKDIVHAMGPALLGAALDKMNLTMANNLPKVMNQLMGCDGEHLDLYLWCRKVVTVASSKAVWGPLNPFDDQSVESAFWDYDSNLGLLLMNTLPQITARKAYRGREKLVSSFIKYYEAGGQHNSSELAYARWKAQSDAGCSTEAIARLEAATAIAVLSNTTTTAFWMLFDVYSRPELLNLLYGEIKQNALTVDAEGTHTIDIARIREGCPALVSTFQEVLRSRSMASPLRIVREDIILNDEYLLKAGSILIMPSRSINNEASVWGESYGTFDPMRFQDSIDKKPRPNSFMAFGVAPALCPGRHFASGEILAIVAMLVLRFDIKTLSGIWETPKKVNTSAVATTIPPPDEAFDVVVTPRVEFVGSEWAFNVTEGKGRFGLITG